MRERTLTSSMKFSASTGRSVLWPPGMICLPSQMQFHSRARIRILRKFLPSSRPTRPPGRPSHPPSLKRIGQLYAPSFAPPLERADGGARAPHRPVPVSVDKTTLHLASDAAWPRGLPPISSSKADGPQNVNPGKQSQTATFPIDFTQPRANSTLRPSHALRQAQLAEPLLLLVPLVSTVFVA